MKEKIFRLYQKGLTTREVAEKIGLNHRTVAYHVKKAGLSRPRTTRLHILQSRASKCKKFSSKFIKYLDGLLSDGHIAKPCGVSFSTLYSQSCTCKSWLEKIAKTMESKGIICRIRPDKRLNRKLSWCLQSWRYDKLLDVRNRWYKDGIKIIPNDIDLSDRNLLKNWIYGDGTLRGFTLRLCTDSFTLKDVDFLINKLNELGNFKFKRIYFGKRKDGIAKYRISICKRDGLLNFYKYVGNSDISEFQYKWVNK